MKRIITVLTFAILSVSLLAACGQSASSASSGTASSEVTSSSAASSAETSSAASSDAAAADTAKLDAIVTAVEAVNPVANPRVIDDFSLANEMGVTADNIVAFKGDVTNDQADCALVFAAQAKEGTVDTVKAELETYKESMSSTLYAEFADKVAKAQDARIVTSGNYVVMVISGISGPDYADIDTAINAALA